MKSLRALQHNFVNHFCRFDHSTTDMQVGLISTLKNLNLSLKLYQETHLDKVDDNIRRIFPFLIEAYDRDTIKKIALAYTRRYAREDLYLSSAYRFIPEFLSNYPSSKMTNNKLYDLSLFYLAKYELMSRYKGDLAASNYQIQKFWKGEKHLRLTNAAMVFSSRLDHEKILKGHYILVKKPYKVILFYQNQILKTHLLDRETLLLVEFLSRPRSWATIRRFLKRHKITEPNFFHFLSIGLNSNFFYLN